MAFREKLSTIADTITEASGSVWAGAVAFSAIVFWAVTGPLFKFSSTWQLVINTGTTIVTFLMVFAIQHTQNRETRATQLKLDELIRASKAHNDLIAVEQEDDRRLKQRARQSRERKK